MTQRLKFDDLKHKTDDEVRQLCKEVGLLPTSRSSEIQEKIEGIPPTSEFLGIHGTLKMIDGIPGYVL